MTSFRQIEANRRNARLGTGRGRRRQEEVAANAVRHGLTQKP